MENWRDPPKKNYGNKLFIILYILFYYRQTSRQNVLILSLKCIVPHQLPGFGWKMTIQKSAIKRIKQSKCRIRSIFLVGGEIVTKRKYIFFKIVVWLNIKLLNKYKTFKNQKIALLMCAVDVRFWPHDRSKNCNERGKAF